MFHPTNNKSKTILNLLSFPHELIFKMTTYLSSYEATQMFIASKKLLDDHKLKYEGVDLGAYRRLEDDLLYHLKYSSIRRVQYDFQRIECWKPKIFQRLQVQAAQIIEDKNLEVIKKAVIRLPAITGAGFWQMSQLALTYLPSLRQLISINGFFETDNQNLDRQFSNQDLERRYQYLLLTVKRVCISQTPSNYWLKDLFQLADLSLESIEFSNNNIRSLTNLLIFEQLQTLCLSHNIIENIKPLASLTNLRHLDLSHNKITSIEPLSSLQALQKLSLARNHIVMLPIKLSLPQLKELNLDYNRIQSFFSLSSLKQLTTLSLKGNHIKNIDSLSALRTLTKLDLSHNSIQNLETLVKFNALKDLHLGSNNLSNVEIVARLKGLETLSLSCNSLDRNSLYFFRELKSLKDLNLLRNKKLPRKYRLHLKGLSVIRSILPMTKKYKSRHEMISRSPLAPLQFRNSNLNPNFNSNALNNLPNCTQHEGKSYAKSL